mmetsp:Transcript_58282/g.125204  ORF Transcript_58282/g.125204 Transcript_58282/m.125204 type:complete len:114 (+) Transcript_58282:73-414(+)
MAALPSPVASERSSALSRSASTPGGFDRPFAEPTFPVSPLSKVGSACVYFRTNQAYGEKFPRAGLRPPEKGVSNRFSKYCGEAGMYINSGLDTKVLPEVRHMDRARDWTEKFG